MVYIQELTHAARIDEVNMKYAYIIDQRNNMAYIFSIIDHTKNYDIHE